MGSRAENEPEQAPAAGLKGPSRRVVLRGAAVAGAAVAGVGMTACGSDEEPQAANTPSGTAPPSSPPAEPSSPAPEPTATEAPTSTPPRQTPTRKASPPLARTSEIPVGGGKVFRSKKVVVTQPAKGQFKGFSTTCTHQGCPVNEVSGGLIKCPCHGSQYRIEDASVADGPAPRPLRTVRLRVSGGDINLA